jgi:lipoate-protein ligase A
MYHYTYWGRHTLPAVDNMALEEFFLKDSADNKTAHIRFYDFAGDTVVLGYNQGLGALKKWGHDFSIVRRGSGGSHVHVGDNILAYSFIIPRDGSFRFHNDFRAYYADKIKSSLEKLGLQDIVVDNKASTIMTENRVIASHAVAWGVKSALLHGILHITPYEVDKVMSRVYLGYRRIGNNIYTEANALRNIPALAHILPKIKPNATPEQRQEYFKELLSETILREVAGKDYERTELSDQIRAMARAYREAKYSQERWIKHRDPVHTPEEIEELPGEELTGPLKEGWGYCLYIQVPDKDFKKMADPEDKF